MYWKIGKKGYVRKTSNLKVVIHYRNDLLIYIDRK